MLDVYPVSYDSGAFMSASLTLSPLDNSNVSPSITRVTVPILSTYTVLVVLLDEPLDDDELLDSDVVSDSSSSIWASKLCIYSDRAVFCASWVTIWLFKSSFSVSRASIVSV